MVLKSGDVVRLKSSGPKMTVNFTKAGASGIPEVYCNWFTSTGSDAVSGASFSEAMLELVQP